MKPGYKQTEVGVIPEEWEVKAISSFAPLQRGFDLPTSQLKPGAHPVVYSNGVLTVHETAMAKGPGVITGRSGTIGKVHFVEDDYWPHNTTLWVTSFRGSYPKYVFYLFQRIGLGRFSTGSGVPTLNRNDVHVFRVPLPPLSEQRAIAAALSDADALIAALDRLIAKKRAIKQAAMQQLLAGKTRLPGFREKWEVRRLGSVLKFQVGFPFASTFFNEKGIGIRLVKNRDLKSDDQIFYYSGDYDTAFLVRNGDVLIGMDGDFLPCLWTKGSALLNQRVGRIIPIADLHCVFAFYYLTEPLNEIERATSSTTVKHLSHGDIEDIEKPLPCIDEQRAIAAVLSDMDAEIAALEKRRDKTRALKQGMMQELLTGRTRLV